jgi:uncharacterized protein YjbI with pentapeptide repeats
MVAALPGLVALIALVFAYLSIQATNDQLKISEEGQITDRYNAAITNLGDAASTDVRLGGIYALQRLMQDSPRDQPTVVAVLCAFIRDNAPATTTPLVPASAHFPTDIQAALTVITTRNAANDGSATVVDLNHTQLVGADLTGAYLYGANLVGAKLVGANLTKADLARATLEDADLDEARLGNADLDNADLVEAHFVGAYLYGANLTHADLLATDLLGAHLDGADLSRADLYGANLTKADLTRANLYGAVLTGANLTSANLYGAVLTGVDLRHVIGFEP